MLRVTVAMSMLDMLLKGVRERGRFIHVMTETRCGWGSIRNGEWLLFLFLLPFFSLAKGICTTCMHLYYICTETESEARSILTVLLLLYEVVFFSSFAFLKDGLHTVLEMAFRWEDTLLVCASVRIPES